MKNAGDVWWRDDDGVGFASVGYAVEHIMLHPVFVPFAFYGFGIIFRGQVVDAHLYCLIICFIVGFLSKSIAKLLNFG